MQRIEGFTIIEVLLAVALLTVIVLVVMTSLTGSFRLAGNSTLQSSATNQAQAVLESMRGQWQNIAAYDAACLQQTWPTSPAATISIQNETVNGTASGSAYGPTFSSNCATATPLTTLSPLRRVTVTVNNTSGSNASQAQLVLEIARP